VHDAPHEGGLIYKTRNDKVASVHILRGTIKKGTPPFIINRIPQLAYLLPEMPQP